MSSDFGFQQLVELCQRTHREMQIRAGRTVDTFLVVRNWLFGWYIVEYEQRGADRAEYGRRFLGTLSKRLQHLGIRGSSTTRLKLYRAFYQEYKLIGPTLSDQLTMPLPLKTHSEFNRQRRLNRCPTSNAAARFNHLCQAKLSRTWPKRNIFPRTSLPFARRTEERQAPKARILPAVEGRPLHDRKSSNLGNLGGLYGHLHGNRVD